MDGRLIALIKKPLLFVARGKIELNEYVVKDDNSVCYLVLSKNACSSIKKAFLSEAELEDFNKNAKSSYDTHTRKWGSFKRQFRLPKDCPYVFTFVRNPFWRLISAYESKFHTDGKKGAPFHYKYSPFFNREMTFEEFANRVCRIPDCLSDRHFKSQYSSIAQIKDKISYVGNLEEMPESFSVVEEKGLSPISIINKAEKRDFFEYFSSKELLDKICNRYKQDVQKYGYQGFYDEMCSKY